MNKEFSKSIEETENENIEKIKKSISNLENKKSKFIFCIPESVNPVASVYELYFHATVVKRMGYDVIVFVEKDDYVIPNWIENELTDLKHLSMSDNNNLKVGPEDVMVIPEVYSNIMEQTKNLPCLRIGFLQSLDYMINGLIPGINWEMFGINNIITTSKTLEEFIAIYFGKKYKTKSYNIGIPDYFEKSNTPQKPVVSIIGRNPNEISKLVKLFFLKYPEFNWITFDPMLTKSKPPQPMRRVDFAKRLGENFAAVWVDRISSFGTFPLECMKSGVIPISLKPDIMPEYMIERGDDGNPLKAIDDCGVWTNNYYDLPILIADTLIKFLDDSIPEEFYEKMNNVSSKYNQDNSEKELVKIYSEYINERINLFKSVLESNKKNNNEINNESNE